MVGILVVGRGREEGVPAHAGSGHRALRVLRSRIGGVGFAAVDVDHVAVLDGHRADARLLDQRAAQDLHRENRKLFETPHLILSQRVWIDREKKKIHTIYYRVLL